MIKIYGSNWVKGHRGQRSNLCFFLFVPLLLPGPSRRVKFTSLLKESNVRNPGYFVSQTLKCYCDESTICSWG